MEHRYSVYGVAVTSDIAFDFPPPQPQSRAVASVAFVRASDRDLPAPHTAADDSFACDERRDGSVYLRCGSYFDFLVDAGGAQVRYRPLAGADARVLQNFLFGQALSIALVRQGIEPLHAAVIDVGGRAIALLGDCGYGKSTLAATFMRAGHRLLSDDVLVAYPLDGRIVAAAGAGRVKLMPDSAASLLEPGAPGVPLAPNADKRVFCLGESCLQRDHLPLDTVFVLPSPAVRERTAAFEIVPISAASLLPELVTNTFVTPLASARRLEQNFAWNAELAASVRGYRLLYPAGIARLPPVRDAIVELVRHRAMEEAQ